MPNRILREGILTSDAVNKVSWAAEVFYRRLMSVVDDYGRYDGRDSIIRSALYPLKINSVTERNVAQWKAECASASLITVYAVDGKEYVQIIKFDQRLRVLKSKYPEPTEENSNLRTSADICAQMTADDGLNTNTNKNKNKKSDAEALLLPFSSKAFKEAWSDWQNHRREIGKALKPTGIKEQLSKLRVMGEQGAIASIRNSIANGWQGLFEVKTVNLVTKGQGVRISADEEDRKALALREGR